MASLIQLLQNTLHSLSPDLSNETKRIHLKEALQSIVLEYLYNHPRYRALNFYGGTCLRIIYNLNRLSEDIDLDNSQGIPIDNLHNDLRNYFVQNIGYRETTVKQQISQQNIIRYTLRFPVLFDLGLSFHKNEMLHLKVEISQHKQTSIIEHTPVIHYGRSFVPSHFSLETMMAGKILACLERSFAVGKTGISIKGRDYYDLLWFMQQKIHPLEEKLITDGKDSYTIQTAMDALHEKVNKIRKRDLETDLLPLFENHTFIKSWIAAFHSNFKKYIKYYLS